MASSDEGSEPKSGTADAVPGFEPDNVKLVAKKSDTNSSFLRAARSGNLEKVLELLKNNTDINTSNANGLNALHLASKEGHVTIVQEVLKRGATVEAATKKGNTALHIASLAGQLEVIGILLDHGAKINIQSQNGFTPLYMAAQENHVEVVRFLLNHGALQTFATEDGFTPLAVALQQGHDKVVAVLLENDSGGKVHLPALHIAAKKDDVKAAKLLLENDHNVDKTSKTGSLANDTTKSGFTPLHIAAHYGNTNVAKLLIDKGADVNFKARNFIMPLHVSSKWGRGNMVTLLLDNGAIIDSQTRDGLTPLHCAARSGHEQVVDLLLERGSPVATKTKNGLSPLHMAIQGDHVDCARLLLLHKTPINDVTVDYLTPLHVAAHCGNVKTAKLLLDRKCEVNARALNGFTPLHIACKKNRIKVVELLLKYGATIEATTESGLTPIHVAAFMGHMNIVIFLIQHGANPDFTTVRGETALHLAARANQTDIMRILLRNGAQVDARAREQQTPLHIASRLGNVDNVLLLLQHGASPDATMKDLSTPLHIAAKEGHDEVALVLLEHGASQNLTTKKGFTTLHVAAKFGRIKVARLLLEKGADPNIEGRNGLTPIHVATHYNHINVALLLLEKGANPCVAAKNGYTALHIAAKKNQMDIATTLLQHGAKPNVQSRNGFTPLHLATQENHTDMVSLLLEHDAEANCKAKNGLTPMHLAAQEDGVPVAEILVKYGSQIDSQTKAGYTPLHTACHFGQINMIRFLLERNANIDSRTKLGYTPLHHAAQQGHVLVVKLLLKYTASPNHVTNTGQTAMSIAQRLGYISVVEILRPVTDATVALDTMDEKYKVIVPEIMQEAPMSDSEDEGSDDHTLPDQSFQYYLASDGNKVFQDDSVAPNKESRDLFAFDGRTRKRSMSSSMGPGIIQEELKYMRGEDDVVDGKKEIKSEVISRQYVGTVSAAAPGASPVVARGDSSRPCSMYDVDNVIPSSSPSFSHLKWKSFLVSFLVDARGGAMRGCRHSGVRIVVPPNCALMPTRITCRLVKREKLLHPPPLMEGEALASRILEMGPVGAKLLGPMVIEVPHFASLHGEEREIAILRSDNGQTWMEHVLPPTDDAAQDFIQSQFDDLDNLEEFQLRRLVRIVTTDFPQYFALVSRVRQDVSTIGCDGGVLSSKVIPQVQAVFPPTSLNKTTKVGLQAQLVPPELVSKLLGNRVAVSPLVTIEPRRRKFHKPITLTIPLPKAAQKGMLNQYGGDMPNLRLLCSVSGVDTFSYLRGESACLDISSSNWKGGANPAVWEDITGSTPLTLVNDCVSFTTSVSARFWLMDCQNVSESTKMAADLYQEVASVPFMSKFVVFAKHHDLMEARLRVFCMTDDRLDKTLENQEHFVEVARSRDIEVLEDKPLFIEMGGNLIPVTKSGDQLYLVFHAFRENRLPFVVRIRNTSQEAKGRLAFMKEPKVARGEISESPVCNLNIRLPGRPSPVNGEQVDVGALRSVTSQFSMEEHISKAELRLTDIADLLQADWIPLAEQLGVSDNEVTRIQSEYEYVSEQALVMLHLWVQKNENQATGNDLERALKQIGRDDVIASCMCNVKEVTDLAEKAVARVYLDASYDPLKDEIGSSNEFDSSRGSSMHRGQSLDVSYDEQDRPVFKESESFTEETGSEAGSVIEREYSDKRTGDGSEYELEEVWDGTQWNVVRKTEHKISRGTADAERTPKAAPDREDAPEFSAAGPARGDTSDHEAVPESGATADAFEKTEETLDLDEWEVVDDLPADEQQQQMLEELDVTPQQLPYPEQATVLDDIIQAAAILKTEEEEREQHQSVSSKTEVRQEEEVLDDGTNIRRRITITRQVRATGGKWGGLPESEETVGTEVEEEVLQLAPGIVEPFGSDLEQEVSVEDFEESLPDGTWVKRKVTTVVIKPKRMGAGPENLDRTGYSSGMEERHFDHSHDSVSIISQGGSLHSEEAAASAVSDPVVAEEIIIPQQSSRPLREPRPQEASLSSPEEEGEEELVERIEAIRAEAQYSMPTVFATEAVEEPIVAVQISRKAEVSMEASSSIVEETIVQQQSSRPLREPRPQEASLSSPEEEGEEELVERIEAIRAEAQYSMPTVFATEAVEENVVAVQISRKIEVSMEASSSVVPPSVSMEEPSIADEDLNGGVMGSSTSSEHFQLGLSTPQIAVQAASPMVQSPDDDAQETEEKIPGAVDMVQVCRDAVAELEDRRGEERTDDADGVVAEDRSVPVEDILVFEDRAFIRGRMDEDNPPSEDRGTDEDDERTMSPVFEVEMAGRISVDTSQQIFIEQMIEASRESSGLSPSESRPTEFSVVVDRADDASSHSQSSSAMVDFSRDLTIRPIDLSPLTPTPEPVEQKLPTLFDTVPSPRDQNETEDWPQEGAEEDDDGASASSLSEVAQVDDVGGPQESTKEAELAEKSDETDVDEAFSPAPKDNGFDPQRSSPTVLSQSPLERISPSKELALKEDVSPVTEHPRDMRKLKINVGLSPSGFIEEEEEVEEEEVEEEEEEGEEEREEAEVDVYFKPIPAMESSTLSEPEATDMTDSRGEKTEETSRETGEERLLQECVGLASVSINLSGTTEKSAGIDVSVSEYFDDGQPSDLIGLEEEEEEEEEPRQAEPVRETAASLSENNGTFYSQEEVITNISSQFEVAMTMSAEEEAIATISTQEEAVATISAQEEVIDAFSPQEDITIFTQEVVIDTLFPQENVTDMLSPQEDVIATISTQEEIEETVCSREDVTATISAQEVVLDTPFPQEEVIDTLHHETEVTAMISTQDEVIDLTLPQEEVSAIISTQLLGVNETSPSQEEFSDTIFPQKKDMKPPKYLQKKATDDLSSQEEAFETMFVQKQTTEDLSPQEKADETGFLQKGASDDLSPQEEAPKSMHLQREATDNLSPEEEAPETVYPHKTATDYPFPQEKLPETMYQQKEATDNLYPQEETSETVYQQSKATDDLSPKEEDAETLFLQKKETTDDLFPLEEDPETCHEQEEAAGDLSPQEETHQTVYPQKEATDDLSPQVEDAGTLYLQNKATDDLFPQEEAPKTFYPQREATGDLSPQEGTPEPVYLQKEDIDDPLPQEEAPKAEYLEKEAIIDFFPHVKNNGTVYLQMKATDDLSPQEEVPKTFYPQKETTDDLSPQEEAPETVYPQKEAISDLSPQEEAPETMYPQKGTTDDLSPQEQAPVTVYPQKEANDDLSPQEEAPVTVYRQKEATDDLSPQEEDPVTVYPQKEATDDLSPQEEAPVTVYPQKEATDDLSPQEEAPETLYPQKEATDDLSSQEEAPETVYPQKEATDDLFHQEEAPETVYPQKEANDDQSPQDEASMTVYPQKEANDDLSPQDEAPETVYPQKESTDDVSPQEEAPETVYPQKETTDDLSPQEEALETVYPQKEATEILSTQEEDTAAISPGEEFTATFSADSEDEADSEAIHEIPEQQALDSSTAEVHTILNDGEHAEQDSSVFQSSNIAGMMSVDASYANSAASAHCVEDTMDADACEYLENKSEVGEVDDEVASLDDSSFDLVSGNDLDGFDEYEKERMVHEHNATKQSAAKEDDLPCSSGLPAYAHDIGTPSLSKDQVEFKPQTDAIQSWNSDFNGSLGKVEDEDSVDKVESSDEESSMSETQLEDDSAPAAELTCDLSQFAEFKPKDSMHDLAGVSESSGRDSWVGSSGGPEVLSENERAAACSPVADDENFVFLDESGFDPEDGPMQNPMLEDGNMEASQSTVLSHLEEAELSLLAGQKGSDDHGNEKGLWDSEKTSTRHSVPEEFATSWDKELRTETEEEQGAKSPEEEELEELEGVEQEGSVLGSETKRADE